MHSLSSAARHPLDVAHLNRIFRDTLSLGSDMDGRGLHWRLPAAVCPEQRLAFALAVYFTGGLYILIDSARGFLCVEKIALALAHLKKARGSGSYRIGHAFATLHEALGYSPSDSIGFRLIEAGDAACVEGFIKGFGDCMAQSLEADIARIVHGQPDSDGAAQLGMLRHFIGDQLTVQTVLQQLL